MNNQEENLSELKEYLAEKGFKDGERWYFRGTWMKTSLLKNLQKGGLARKVGTSLDLKRIGVKLSSIHKYCEARLAGALFYEVINSEINQAMEIRR